MRLLFVAPSAYLLGGVQEWLATLLPDLEAAGHRVQLALPDGRLHRFDAYCRAFPQLDCLPLANPAGKAS